MSTSKNPLTKLGGNEVVTGINLAGLVFLYYKYYELGTDLNGKIVEIGGVIKKINRNINIVNIHLKQHLFKHKTELDIEDNEDENSFLLEKDHGKDNIDKVLIELSELKKRIIVLEETTNSILNK